MGYRKKSAKEASKQSSKIFDSMTTAAQRAAVVIKLSRRAEGFKNLGQLGPMDQKIDHL